jgi:hypothetical protein
MNVFEIDTSYINNNYSSISIFLDGLSNSFLLALPMSVPLLICLRRLLVQGIPAGISCYFGTAVGQTFLTFLILFGFSDFIQFWYDWEPLLYFIGMIISVKLLFQFYTDARLKSETILRIPKLLSIAFTNFIIVLFNPVGILNISTLVTTQQFINDQQITFYLLSFFIGLFCFSCLFGFVCYLLRNWFLVFSLKPYVAFMQPINKFIVFGSFSLILSVTTTFTWQLFLQHPIEKLFNNIQTLESFLLKKEIANFQNLREFPMFDSNIQGGEHLLVSRHFPIDSLQQRRIWANKSPLTESQLETVYFRYNIHFVNKLSDFIHKKRFEIRKPLSNKETPEQLKRLKQVQKDYLNLQLITSADLDKKFGFNGREILNRGKGNLNSLEQNYSEPKRNIGNTLNMEKDLELSKSNDFNSRHFFVLSFNSK